MYRKQIITAAAAAAVIAFATGAQGGCQSASGGAKPGSTLVVGGDTNEAVTCNEIPYDVALDQKEADGTGIVVTRGFVRGAMWVTCTGAGPDTFKITVTLMRNGLLLGTGIDYDARPNAVGYAASVFTKCVPGVYRLQYRYSWTLQGGVEEMTMTVATNEVVTARDCDA